VGRALVLRGPLTLILDNLEQIADAASGIIVTWLDQSSALVVVATSRRPLHAPGEWVGLVPPLTTASSRELLHSRVSVAPDSSDTARLLDRLGGLPLAIELAARTLNHTPAKALIARLEEGLRSLEANPTSLQDARHRTLEDVLQWSWDLLDDAAQRACAMLTVFRGAFSSDAAEAVLVPPLGANEVRQLVEHSLLELEPSGERYRFHVAVREFADRSVTPEDLDLLATRHARWFAARWEHARSSSVRLPVEDLDDFVGAARQCPDPELRLACSLGAASILERHGSVEDIIAVTPPLSLRTQLSVDSQVDLLCQVFGATLRADRLDEAERALDELAALAHTTNHDAGLVLVRRGQAALHGRRGDLTAEASILEALLATPLPEEHRGFVLNNLACAYKDLGRYDEAESAFLGAVDARTRDAEHGLGPITNLAALYLYQGRLIEARELAASAVVTSRKLKTVRRLAAALRTMGVASAALGEPRRAVAHLEEALSLRRRIGTPLNAAAVLVELGPASSTLGDHQRADDQLREAASLYRDLRFPSNAGLALARRAEVHLALHNLSQAVALAEQSLRLTVDDRHRAAAWRAMGRVRQAQGALEVAQRAFVHAVEHATADGDPLLVAAHQICLGLIWKDMGRDDEARSLLKQAHAEVTHRGARPLSELASLGWTASPKA
ncbi:MAG: tetratricopeptide repeat protein, partial [Myxococcota bacterium]